MMFSRSMVTSSLAVLFVATSTSWAQTAAPPEQCGQVVTASGATETSVSACTGELFAAQADMINAVEELVTEMQAMNLSGMVAKQSGLYRSVMDEDLSAKVQSMRNEHGRGLAASEAVAEADYEEAFEKADKKKGENCTFSDKPFVEGLGTNLPPGLKPVTGDSLDDFGSKFGDGKCNVFKARIDNPGEADDDKVVQVNERREGMCETVCEDRENPNSNNARKKERKERVGGRLTDGIAATIRATERINEAKSRLTSLRIQLAEGTSRATSSSDICVSGADPSEGFAIAATAVSIANSLVSFGTIIAETVKDSVEPPANQSVAGFNAGSAVIPFAVVAGGFKIAQEILSAIEKGLLLTGQILSASRTDTIELCLKSVRDDAVVLQSDLFAPFACVGGSKEGDPCGTADDCDGGTCEGGAILQLQRATGDTNAALAALTADVAYLRILLETNQELLNTPTGRREGFNDKSTP